ncbi:Dad2p [Cyberlindnera jadinii NRRL Y-1542]|uniref:DASH complex subunit DAD2 n=1 Tax=Cyberlindnera jadinii (strain ATCC 18201 / CBS 1600 / BCRC 20928 / JCM 3617 / NBRC 0987 / NRRL Y-1542) TaxID=983966 RepID=A0A1E4S9L8_CYBJN|nr:DASH complex, subunit Dad2 [Cyberlindnera jadinii NRRL Y-1542]ODV76191.1 DASH complex, subunit Dad2 [Cyberlindnera jadinii NRRL Y-1542]
MSLQQRIEEKKRELEHLSQIKELSLNLCNQLENLEAKLETLADGSEAVALVMSNWNHIIKSVSLASMSLTSYTEQSYENKEDPPLPETLVRLRIHDDVEEQ